RAISSVTRKSCRIGPATLATRIYGFAARVVTREFEFAVSLLYRQKFARHTQQPVIPAISSPAVCPAVPPQTRDRRLSNHRRGWSCVRESAGANNASTPLCSTTGFASWADRAT